MADISEELKESVKTKISLKILGKNMMSLPGIARDMNVARQNVQQLVKIMGGEAATGADAHMLKESERGAKFDVESAKEKEKIQKEKVQAERPKKESKKPSFFEKIKQTKVGKKVSNLKERFSQNKFVKAFTKYFKLIVIFGLLFVIFKDAIVEWAKGLYETIKEKFDEFVGKIKEWFNEVVQPIIDKVKAFIMPIVEKIGEFFKSIGDWFVDKFGFIGEWFTNTFSFVGKIVDKFKAMIEGVKDYLRNKYENSGPLKHLVPDVFVKFIGAKTEKEKEEEKKKEELQKKALSNVVDDSREAKKLQQQQGEAQKAEAERADIPRRQEERQKKIEERDRVAALEKEKQYTGTDEIVRARLGLPSVSAAEMEVGPEVTQPRTPLAPTAVVAEVPQAAQKAPSPISAEPPTATGKQAEGPAGGGSLASVASVQPGVDLSSINPEFEKRLVNMATAFKEQTGKKVLITSAYRSNEKQAELFNAKLKEVGGDRAAARRMVAEPMPPLGQGRGSFHLKGLAIDMNSKGPGGINVLAGSRDSPTGWLEKFGLTRPVKNEDWHIQPSGTVPTADNPVSPGAPTLVAGKDGKPMNVTDGKKETMPQASAMQTVASGGEVSTASNQIAVSHREQIKPQTPVVVNAPVTNNNITQTNQTLTKGKPCGSSDALVNRVA